MKFVKIIFVIIILSIVANSGNAQNLVPNSSFEIKDTCPQYYSKLFYAPPWFQPCIYYGNPINSCSSDLYDSCCTSGEVRVPSNAQGYQLARTGKSYGGIFCNIDTLNAREYLEVQLSAALISGNQYCVEFYVSLAENSRKATSNIGAYFSTDSLLDTSAGNAISYVMPQIENNSSNYLIDKSSWTKIFGTFTANGGERFVTIGNFRTPSNTFLQNVSGGSIDFVYYYIDDISVTPCDTGTYIHESINNISFNLFPNPSNGDIHLNYTLKANEKGKMLVYDLAGKKVIEYVLPSTASQLQINDIGLESGVYLYKISINDRVVKSDKLIIIK